MSHGDFKTSIRVTAADVLMVIAIPLGCFLDLLVINASTTRDVDPQAVL